MEEKPKEVLPLEDAPKGTPVTYGPMGRQTEREVAINPFWSDRVQERAKDDAVLRSLRPQGLPAADAASTSRSSGGPEDGTDLPDVRQLLALVIQQNNQLKQEVDFLKGRVDAQPTVTRVVEQVVVRAEEGPVKEIGGSTLAIQDGPVLPQEDVKSEDVGQGVEWNTPPESVSAKRQPGSSELRPGGTVDLGPMDQQQVLGQVTQTLSTLVSQLTAAGAPATVVAGAAQGPPSRCMGPGGEGTWSAMTGGSAINGHGLGGGGVPPNGSGGFPGGSGQLPTFGGGSNGGGMGGPGVPRMAPFQLPTWFQGAGESIRTVDLPPLPAIKEGELGGVVVGDWLALISPVMKDLSVSSGLWWDAVVTEAQSTYNTWLHSEPLQRLYLSPDVPGDCRTQWARLEQRGQSMLLQALPEGLRSEMLANRVTHTVEIVYRVLTRYQPGGLGEKALLLRQLVEGRSPTNLMDFLDQIKTWKRSLRRAQELKVATPDPTLLIGALDKMSGVVVKSSPQAAFRLNSMRTQLMVDVNPTLPSVVNYADSVMAEAESLFHGGVPANATVKVKALEGGAQAEASQKGEGKGKSQEKSGKGDRFPCKVFGTEDGCKKGADCSYIHDWNGIEKKGRCWNCSSTKHSRRDCTVKAMTSKGSSAGDSGGKGKNGGEKGKGSDANGPAPALKKADQPSEQSAKEEESKSSGTGGGHPRVEGDLARAPTPPVQELMQEAAALLKSLKGPVLKAIKVNSLEVQSHGQALLDGGATHALRTTKSMRE